MSHLSANALLYRVKVLFLLILCSAFTIVLVDIRINWANTNLFKFLNWNLFLAWGPFMVSTFIWLVGGFKRRLLVQLPLLMLWLVFLPNSMYIITDLMHLKSRAIIPLWFDVLMFFSCAWTGLLLGYLSVKDVHLTIQRDFGVAIANISSILFMFLSGMGIYLGRYKRWNSWDVITDHEKIRVHLLDYLLNPTEHLWLYKFTLAMGIFLTFGYWVFYVLTERKQERVLTKANT